MRKSNAKKAQMNLRIQAMLGFEELALSRYYPLWPVQFVTGFLVWHFSIFCKTKGAGMFNKPSPDQFYELISFPN